MDDDAEVIITGIDISFNDILGIVFKFYFASCFASFIIFGGLGMVTFLIVVIISLATGSFPNPHF